MKRDLRPNRSATLPKNRRREPDDRLKGMKCQTSTANQDRMTYEEDAQAQVVSALVIFKSLLRKEVITVTEPLVNEDIATAIVAVRTNRISWAVDLKHSGRAPGFALIFMVSWVPIAASRSPAVNTCLSRVGEVEVMAAGRTG